MPECFKVVCIPCKALYKCSDLPLPYHYYLHRQQQQQMLLLETTTTMLTEIALTRQREFIQTKIQI